MTPQRLRSWRRGRDQRDSEGAVRITNKFDIRGADPAQLRRLEQVVMTLYKTIPDRAVAALPRYMARNPGF